MLLSMLLGAQLTLLAQPLSTAATPLQPDVREVLEMGMDDAVSIAIEQSFRVMRAQKSLDMSDLQVDSARAAIRPRFDSYLSVGQIQNYSRYSGNALDYAILSPDFSATLSVSGSLPLDFWGVTGRSIEQAEYSRESVELNLEQTKLEVVIDARVNYIRALQAKERADQSLAKLASVDRLIQVASVEQPSVVDYLRLERDLAQQRAKSAATQFEVLLARLVEVLRLPPNSSIRLTDAMPDALMVPNEEDLLRFASQNRSDLLQAEIRLEQARLRRKQSNDDRRPSIQTTAFANRGISGRSPLLDDSESGRSLAVGVAVQLRVPFLHYDGGVRRNSRRIADIQGEQALLDHVEALERTQAQISQILISLERSVEQLNSLPDVEQARSLLLRAETVLLSARPEEAAGLIAQVSNARDALFDASLARSDTLADFHLNASMLSRAIGADFYQLNRSDLGQ